MTLFDSDSQLARLAQILFRLALIGLVVTVGGRLATIVLGDHPLKGV